MAVYTVGVWQVKPGEEDAFTAAWQAMAAATAEEYPGASAMLLRDRDTPTLFISAGPWDSLDQIDTWRASATFTTGAAAIRPHLQSFEPHTMDPVVTIGD